MKYLITRCFSLCLVASVQSVSADKIYQSVDEHGNPTFSDSVPADAVEAEAIELPSAPMVDPEVGASQRRAQEAINAADEGQKQRDMAQQEKDAAIETAQQRVEAAEANLAAAKVVREGDRRGLAGGGSRLTPEYQNRVDAAEQELARAQQALQHAQR